jgi:beta-glucosidase
MKKKHLLLSLLPAFFILLYSCSGSKNETDKQVEELLSQMTLEEKVGQMTQITLDVIGNGPTLHRSLEPFAIDTARLNKAIGKYYIGSVLNTTNNYALKPERWYEIISQIQEAAINQTRLKIPVIYGVDAIHGATYTDGATIFPQQIAMAATFNPQLVHQMASVTAYETKASGIPWNFSPVLDLGGDPRFSRQYEGFGEDPYVVTVLGEQMIAGYQGLKDSLNNPVKLAACLKHYLGYGVPFSGKDRTPAFIPENVLREYHLPPFKKAVEAGAASVMVNSGIINGVSVHASYDLITKLLKEELQFEGVVVTDWQDIINLHSRDKIATSVKEAIKISINAGIDMSMVPYKYEEFCDNLIALVKAGEVSESRIDDAVRRILKMKFQTGLFEKAVTHYKDYPDFGSEKFKKMAYHAASEAITLLKNENNILPLNKNNKILVTGPNANSMRCMNGGWTYSWQGERANQFASGYNTFLEAVELEFGKNNVQHVPGVSYIDSLKYFNDTEDQFEQAIAAARKSDVVLLFAGENSYTEKPGDLNDLNLSALQTSLAKALIATGKPVILILNEGRPRCISQFEKGLKAVVQTYLPGNFGGDALADILSGDVNPSGKLPYNYPSYPNSLTNYYHKPAEEQVAYEGVYQYASDYNPQYEFGHGLSYTTFAYSNLKSDKVKFSNKEEVKFEVTVKNTGNRTGKETVLLYTSDKYASITPDVKRLRRFEKITLNPDESKTVTFTLSAQDLAFVNSGNQWITEPGEFEILVGNQKITIMYQ